MNVKEKPDFTTAEEVRKHATDMELAGLDFLDARGQVGARGQGVKHVRLYFIDGAQALVTWQEFNKLSDFSFKLRPTNDDA